MSSGGSSGQPSSIGGDFKLTDQRKYILLVDSHIKSKKSSHSLISKVKFSSKHDDQKVLKGSLWEQREISTPNSSSNSIGSANSKHSSASKKVMSNAGVNETKLQLDSLEYENTRLICPESHVAELTDYCCRLLQAIPDDTERYRFYKDKDKLSSCTEIDINSKVLVDTRLHGSLSATVRWRGRISTRLGIWFGVEIEDKKDVGDTDGTLSGVAFFHCPQNSGLFVNVSSLTHVSTPGPPAHINGNGTYSSACSTATNSDISQELIQVCEAAVGDRVVWLSADGIERATVKWVGMLPSDDNIKDGETLVGVEFDNPVGKGTGYYQKQRLFSAKKGHASLVPLEGLYREIIIDRESTPPSPPLEFSDEQDFHPHTAENILKSLGIDYDVESEIATPQLTKSNPQPASPRRRMCNGKIHKPKSALETEECVRSSDDSIDGSPNKKLSPRRRKATTNNSIISSIRPQQNTALRVPASDHRPSSIGSISPRSYDGSDSQSSPTHSHFSPSRTSRTQPTVRQINKQTPNHSSNISCRKPSSQIVRATPTSGHVREGSSVIAGGERGTVQWIGYEETRPDRFFAGVKLEKPNSSCTSGWYCDQLVIMTDRCDILFVNLEDCLPQTPERCHEKPNGDKSILGKWKGIQGEYNSKYLEACLFAMFARTRCFDCLIEKCLDKATEAGKLSSVLLQHIVTPLRAISLVKAPSVTVFKQFLEDLTPDICQSEPWELIDFMQSTIIPTSSLIMFSNGQTCNIFHIAREKESRIACPTVQELIEHTCAQEKLKFKQIPQCLVVHIPRTKSQQNGYNNVFPNVTLDISGVVEGAARFCYVCGEEATWECPECYQIENNLRKSTYCTNCSMMFHKHDKRLHHMPIELSLMYKDREGLASRAQHAFLTLASVICTADFDHYIAYCQDSMSNPESSQWVSFNCYLSQEDEECIPEVKLVEESAVHWLSERNIGNNTIELPYDVAKLVKDSVTCIYTYTSASTLT